MTSKADYSSFVTVKKGIIFTKKILRYDMSAAFIKLALKFFASILDLQIT